MWFDSNFEFVWYPLVTGLTGPISRNRWLAVDGLRTLKNPVGTRQVAYDLLGHTDSGLHDGSVVLPRREHKCGIAVKTNQTV